MFSLRRHVFLALALALLGFMGWAWAKQDMALCKWNEFGYVRAGYQDGRFAGRCDEFGRLVR